MSLPCSASRITVTSDDSPPDHVVSMLTTKSSTILCTIVFRLNVYAKNLSYSDLLSLTQRPLLLLLALDSRLNPLDGARVLQGESALESQEQRRPACLLPCLT